MKNKQKSKLAISSLILSIIGFSSIIFLYLSSYTCIIGPAVVISAILYGHFVKARIRKNPIIFGKKLVTAGLIIGYIYIAIFTVFLIHLYFLDNAMIDGYRMFKIEKVVRRCNGYISNNNGKFPKNLQHIFKYNDNQYAQQAISQMQAKGAIITPGRGWIRVNMFGLLTEVKLGSQEFNVKEKSDKEMEIILRDFYVENYAKCDFTTEVKEI